MVSSGPTVNVLHDDGNMQRNWVYSGSAVLATVTVNAGEVARFTYDTYGWGSEQELEVTDGTTSYVLNGFSSYSTYVSTTDFTTTIPNGLLGAGTWDFISTDPGANDYTDTKLVVESVAGTSWPAGYVPPVILTKLDHRAIQHALLLST